MCRCVLQHMMWHQINTITETSLHCLLILKSTHRWAAISHQAVLLHWHASEQVAYSNGPKISDRPLWSYICSFEEGEHQMTGFSHPRSRHPRHGGGLQTPSRILKTCPGGEWCVSFCRRDKRSDFRGSLTQNVTVLSRQPIDAIYVYASSGSPRPESRSESISNGRGTC